MIKLKKKRRNPQLEQLANEILEILNPDKIEYLAEGDYAEVYKFSISKSVKIEHKILKPGIYVLKILKLNQKFYFEDIKYLKKLSRLNLIPKIYIICKNYMIMEWIDAKTLAELLDSDIHPGKLSIVFRKINRLVDYWHDENIAHGDLHKKNILINEDLNPYFIDPIINSKQFEDDRYIISYIENKYLNNL
jgi:tRNA A-37 threonylcarbamoyl transferase component Bud32